MWVILYYYWVRLLFNRMEPQIKKLAQFEFDRDKSVRLYGEISSSRPCLWNVREKARSPKCSCILLGLRTAPGVPPRPGKWLEDQSSTSRSPTRPLNLVASFLPTKIISFLWGNFFPLAFFYVHLFLIQAFIYFRLALNFLNSSYQVLILQVYNITADFILCYWLNPRFHIF